MKKTTLSIVAIATIASSLFATPFQTEGKLLAGIQAGAFDTNTYPAVFKISDSSYAIGRAKPNLVSSRMMVRIEQICENNACRDVMGFAVDKDGIIGMKADVQPQNPVKIKQLKAIHDDLKKNASGDEKIKELSNFYGKLLAEATAPVLSIPASDKVGIIVFNNEKINLLDTQKDAK
ncbi:hypothetical protein E0765_07385 [Sulfuricurvum sp. IAE1]|uniref:hypothetical protein n=1 Tax=Sulfuricurvum sp. IAE1 TaxID=2546102 RepID=UPI00104C7262|nr:hypothetical protein [Sulfuricurvum sp. IAE1]TDA63649.1 hypothetical protein E0765_07385 [Sulfuricurvum sp. IAE1]